MMQSGAGWADSMLCWGLTKRQGAWGMGHGAWGMGHGAWGIGHRA